MSTIATKSYHYSDTIYCATKILFIGNMNVNITDEVLKRRFGIFGDIINIEISENGTFAFMEFILRTSVSNAIIEGNGQMLKKSCIYLDYGTVTAPRCLLVNGIPNSVDEACLVDKINYHLSKSKLGKLRGQSVDDSKRSALLYFDCDIHEAFDSLCEFYINGTKLEVEFASTFCMFSHGDFADLTIFKANTELKQNRNIHCVTNEQFSTRSFDDLLINSTFDPNIHIPKPAELQNNNSVHNDVFDNSCLRNIRSPTFKSFNSETVLPAKTTIYPRIRVIPITQLIDGNTYAVYQTSHASTDNSSHLLGLRDDEPLDLSANQSISNNAIEPVDNQESNTEQIKKQNLHSNKYFEMQKPTENIEPTNLSHSADNIEQNITDNFVDEKESLVTNEEYEIKPTISKHLNNSTLTKNVRTNQKIIKRKKSYNADVKIEVDEPFIKYESMYDKVKARSNRNSQKLEEVQVKKEPNSHYLLRTRKKLCK